MDRRHFLALSAGTGAAGLIAGPVAAAVKSGGGAPDVAVVGAGAFGGWTALCLRERGLSVLSLDEYGPANPRASSAGETRSIRSGYGAMDFYSGWAAKAMPLWEKRQAEFQRTILYPNERLEIAQSWNPALTAQRATFDALRLPYEVLDRQQLRSRWPQMNFDDAEFGFVETAKSAAVIKAREAMIRASEVFQKKGGTFRIGRAEPGEVQGRKLLSMKLGDGSTVAAGEFVFACGAWSPKTLPGVMKPLIKIVRSEYYYWGVPAGDERFSWPRQPAWHDHIDGGYGFGSIERGLKYSPDDNGAVSHDPDTAERLPTPYLIEKGRLYVNKRFPAMRDAPIVETRVCQWEIAPNEDFIIDRHPDFDNVWIASGGGSHGFKFGPLLGEYVADRVTGRSTDAAIDRRFTVKRG